VWWIESTVPVHGSMDSSLNEGHRLPDRWPRSNRRRVCPGSNLVRRFIDERPLVDLVRERHSSSGGSGLTAGHHGRSLEMGGTVATVLHLLQGFFLWLRNNAGNSFH
jgi:hypothetical protein